MTKTQMFSHQDVQRRIDVILDKARYVGINYRKLADTALFMEESIESQWWKAHRHTAEHYQMSPLKRADDDAIMFTLVNMAQMWQIWERTTDGNVRPWHFYSKDELYIGASGITAAHMRALKNGCELLNPDYLSNLKLSSVEDIYRDDHRGIASIPNLQGRLAKFNEIGRVLSNEFNNAATKLLERARGFLYRSDGHGLIQLLAHHFPISFGDFPFFKLANAGVVIGLLALRDSGLPSTHEFVRLTTFNDLDNLQGGADYYRPLFLLRLGILEPNHSLTKTLVNSTPIETNGKMEHEIRAGTLVALRKLTELVGSFPVDLLSVEVETHAQAFLRCRHCRVGISDEELFCSYKPVCAAYNTNHELMKIGWPLVETTSY